MKLGVLTNLLGSVSLEEALKYFKSLGLEMVEIGCGGYPGKDHADPDILLNDEKALEDFKALLKKYDVEMPIIETVYKVLFEGLEPKTAINELMTREPKFED